MSRNSSDDTRLTERGVEEDLQRQPHLFVRLAENALTVAESLRGNYFRNTATFVAHLRRVIASDEWRGTVDPILSVRDVEATSWADVQQEVVTFIDGGVGQVQLASQVPILLRVGSYRVRTGERRVNEREQFGYYPVILGDLEGGSKARKDFIDIVRITAELLAGMSALERTPDLRVLMFHGPLVYLVGSYAGHTPFTEADIDLFLRHYAPEPRLGQAIKEEFLQQARLDIYPGMTPERCDEWSRHRVFEPLAFMAFLYRRLIAMALQRTPTPLIAGVVERGSLREFSETVLLERVFRRLRMKNNNHYFNKMYGRSDLSSPHALLERLGYTDSLLMALLLQPGQFSEPWVVNKYAGLRSGFVTLSNDPVPTRVRFDALQPGPMGFPRIRGCYLHVSETTEPLRVEVFDELADLQLTELLRRVLLYARLLPGYGFPIGLDIADKYTHVPAWLTDAYGKLIRHHLSVSLQEGAVSDAEMRRMLIQAIYMTHRDWLFRPDV